MEAYGGELTLLFIGVADEEDRSAGARAIVPLLPEIARQHGPAHTGAVTLIQRFGSALNLNIHFHVLFLDGVYVTTGER